MGQFSACKLTHKPNYFVEVVDFDNEVSTYEVEAVSASEASEPSALAKAYESMKAKHPDAVLLFRCGDFYEAFGEDAKAVSDVLGITLTRRNAKDITAQMAGFPHHALDSYMPKLVRAGKRVAICDTLQSAALGIVKTSFATALICTICSCKFAKACGWHLWHCTKHDEQVSEQSTCPDWEED